MGADYLTRVKADRVVLKWSEEFRKKVVARRKELAMTQEALASSLGVSQGYVCRLEQGFYKFPVITVDRWLNALKVSQRWLLD